MTDFLRRIIWAAAVAMLLLVVVPASAKGNFDKITVQQDGTQTQIEVTDVALLGFFAFTDFDNGTREAPHVVGPAFIVMRWQLDRTGDTGFQPWDRLRYYHTSPDNTLGHGWVFYEGPINGSSEYDGQWFTSTRSADALMEGIIFPGATEQSQGGPKTPAKYIALMGIAAAFAIAGLATRLYREARRRHSAANAI